MSNYVLPRCGCASWVTAAAAAAAAAVPPALLTGTLSPCRSHSPPRQLHRLRGSRLLHLHHFSLFHHRYTFTSRPGSTRPQRVSQARSLGACRPEFLGGHATLTRTSSRPSPTYDTDRLTIRSNRNCLFCSPLRLTRPGPPSFHLSSRRHRLIIQSASACPTPTNSHPTSPSGAAFHPLSPRQPDLALSTVPHLAQTTSTALHLAPLARSPRPFGICISPASSVQFVTPQPTLLHHSGQLLLISTLLFGSVARHHRRESRLTATRCLCLTPDLVHRIERSVPSRSEASSRANVILHQQRQLICQPLVRILQHSVV